jgi:hypothetical protein
LAEVLVGMEVSETHPLFGGGDRGLSYSNPRALIGGKIKRLPESGALRVVALGGDEK